MSDVVYDYVGTYNRLNALCYPLGCDSNGYYAIDISDIKDGSDFDLTFDVELERSSALWTGSTLAFKLIWLDADGVLVGTPYDSEFGFNDDGIAIFDSTFTVPSNAEYALLRLDLGSINVDGVSSFSMTVNDMTLTTTLSALEENSVLLNQVNNTLADLGTSIEEVANGVTITNGKLDDINQSISEGNEKLDDINQGISDANDKLDDMNQGISDTNDKLDQSNEKLDDVNENLGNVENAVESLPGQIGDEIQSVIDQENAKAEAEGNESAGELIDLIPDQSQGFLDGMKDFVTVLSYNGTSAVLAVPAISLPAIDGVMDKTILLDATEIDFEYYFNELIPDPIITLVRALFDVAIVIFCFLEFASILGEIFGANIVPTDQLRNEEL